MVAGKPESEEIRRVAIERDRLGRHVQLLHGVPHQIQPVPRDPVDSPGPAPLQADETLARPENSDPHFQSFRQGAGVAGFLPRPRHSPVCQPHLLRRAPSSKSFVALSIQRRLHQLQDFWNRDGVIGEAIVSLLSPQTFVS